MRINSGKQGVCYGCGAELEPVMPSDVALANIEESNQYNDALPIFFDGGYGMYHDRMDKECRHKVVVCKECADRLLAAVPWIARLFKER